MPNPLNYRRFTILFFIFFLLTPSITHSKNLFYSAPSHFTFKLPSGWEMIPNNIVEKSTNDINKRIAPEKMAKYDLMFSRNEAKSPFDLPYIAISTHNFKVTEAVINKFIKDHSSAQSRMLNFYKQKKIKEIIPESLIKEPIYDSDRHILTQSIENKTVRDNGEVVYVTTVSAFLFYKEGAVAFAFVCGADDIGKYLPTIKSIIQSFNFDEGYEFR